MIDVGRHRSVKLLTMSEVLGIEGKAGDFTVTVLKHPRYVDESRCTACGDCFASCPYPAEDEFDLGLRKRKAIYLYFPQAIPSSALIDRDACQYFRTGKCRICEKVCKSGAIRLNERKKRLKLKVGAVIVATGFDPYNVSGLTEYGFGSIKNVVTALELERMLSASGPTAGEIRRPSDSNIPRSIAFIQCIGSRDERHKPYCSSVCCMHATKEAMLAIEHHPGTKVSVFYTDMRSPGKGFQEYVNRAKDEYDVEYIRSKPGKVTERNGSVVVHYDDMRTRRIRELEVDLVVLSTALIPSTSNLRLAEAIGIELDAHGFVSSPDPLLLPYGTTVPGVLACGYCASPQDIPDSVVQASAAAARAAEILTASTSEKKKRSKTGDDSKQLVS
jgi:heterodisulfide reductase subunit A